jgi:hypothetical protein
MVERPRVAIVKRPTHLHEATAPSERPLAPSHFHHERVNGRCWSMLLKRHQQRTVSAVKKTRGESSRMSRDWAVRALSKRMRNAPSEADRGESASARSVRYVWTGSVAPSRAGRIRIVVYGTVEGYSLRWTANGVERERGRRASVTARVRRRRASSSKSSALCNVLEVIWPALVAAEPGRKGEQQLGERRMNVHKERPPDVLARKAAKVDLIEADGGGGGRAGTMAEWSGVRAARLRSGQASKAASLDQAL